MKLKNPLKPTFKKKREKLGVKRPVNKTSPMQGEANPKIRAAFNSHLLKSEKLFAEFKKISARKPKSELEARKNKEAILLYREKLINLNIELNNKLMKINDARNQKRATRQEQIIFKKLVNILNKSELHSLFKNFIVYDYSQVKTNYRAYLKKTKKTFSDLTSKEAINILRMS